MSLSNISYALAIQDVETRLKRVGLQADRPQITHLINVVIGELATKLGNEGDETYLVEQVFSIPETGKSEVTDEVVKILKEGFTYEVLSVIGVSTPTYLRGLNIIKRASVDKYRQNYITGGKPFASYYAGSLYIYYPDADSTEATISVVYFRTPSLVDANSNVFASPDNLDIPAHYYSQVVETVIAKLGATDK